MSADNPPEALWSKLRRYVSPGWLLEQPSDDLWSAHATRARNREQLARWTPHYVRVHGVLAVVAAALSWALCGAEGAQWASGLVACWTGLEVCLLLVLVSVWVVSKLHERDGWHD